MWGLGCLTSPTGPSLGHGLQEGHGQLSRTDVAQERKDRGRPFSVTA